jgi:N-acetyl-anhydromuramyl-L-alanine amidase AmpD
MGPPKTAAPAAPIKVKFKLRNRLHKVDNIGAAQVQLLDGTSTVIASGVSNGHGLVELNLTAVADGDYSCTITAPNTDSNPVGPALAAGAPVPDRIYRPVTLSVTITGHAIKTATPIDPQTANVAVSGALVVVDVQPVWMKSAANTGRGGDIISMIIVHHTACGLGPAVGTFIAEKGPHYMIDTDGQIVKWVQESRAAWHAGKSRWAGVIGINSVSIGIEIVHDTGPYPEAQYVALLGLLDRLTSAFSSVDTWNIIGHSDIGTDASGVLGRKSGDPGLQFQWDRLEAKRLGMLMAFGPPDLNIYSGFFQTVTHGAFRKGDNDNHRRFGGAVHKTITGTPIQELQQDLTDIGYSLGTPDGDFGLKAERAVLTIQEHFFAGGRGPTPNGRVDFQTAALIKSVLEAKP